LYFKKTFLEFIKKMGSKNSKGEVNKLSCTWKKVNEAPFGGRFDHTLVQIDSECLLIFGGMAEGWIQKNDLWEYNFLNKEWKEITADENVPPPLKDHTAVFHKGKMYVFGGKSGNSFTNSLWIFDIKTKKWSSKPVDESFPPIRAGHSAVIYKDTMYIYGGEGDGGVDLDCMWAYSIDSGKWSKVEHKSAPGGRLYHTATVFKQTMYVTGGFQKKEQLQEFFSFDFKTLAWTKLPDCPFSSRSGHVAVESNGNIFIHGGEIGTHGNGYNSANDLWVYNIKKKKWKEIISTNEAPSGRLGHRACILSNSTLFICGGTHVEGAQWNPSEWFNDLWEAKLN